MTEKEVEVKIHLPKSAYDFLSEIVSKTSGLYIQDWIRYAIQGEIASALENPFHYWDGAWLKNRYDLQAFLDEEPPE
jgi:hypothetical protein